jgi:hypothetical protein
MAEKTVTPVANRPKQVAVPLEWEIPFDTSTIYANNVVVQYSEHECYLLFFEGTPPFVAATTPEEAIAAYDKVKSIKAKCVARVAIPRNLAQKVAKILSDTSAILAAVDKADSQSAAKETAQ